MWFYLHWGGHSATSNILTSIIFFCFSKSMLLIQKLFLFLRAGVSPSLSKKWQLYNWLWLCFDWQETEYSNDVNFCFNFLSYIFSLLSKYKSITALVRNIEMSENWIFLLEFEFHLNDYLWLYIFSGNYNEEKQMWKFNLELLIYRW